MKGLKATAKQLGLLVGIHCESYVAIVLCFFFISQLIRTTKMIISFFPLMKIIPQHALRSMFDNDNVILYFKVMFGWM